MPPKDRNDAINSYVTDMVSLESHIEKAIRSQLEDLKDYPDVLPQLREIHRKVEHHLSDLKALAERREATGFTESMKRAASALAGVAAGVIDLVRTEGLPKDLRDDYTAISLASISYVMLHTTGLSLGDQEVADLARQHYVDYAEALTRLQGLIPASVVRYLGEQQLPVRQDVVSQVNRTIEEVWQSQTGRATGATSGIASATTTPNL